MKREKIFSHIAALILAASLSLCGCSGDNGSDIENSQNSSETEITEDYTVIESEIDNSFYKNYKYGIFVHYVPGLSVDCNGKTYSVNETADLFDAQSFAADIKSTGADYIIFTAWHAGMYTLYPSEVMKSYCPGRYSDRDLLGDLLDAMEEVDIPVFFYTHPYLGYHLSDTERTSTGYGIGNNPTDSNLPNSDTFDYEKWNKFIQSVYGELLDRYGDRIEGLFLDEGTPNAKMGDYVDFAALEKLIKSYGDDLLTIQNFYGTNYSCDIGIKEYGPGWGEFAEKYEAGKWPCYEKPVCVAFSNDWYATAASGTNTVRYSAEDMYRYIVLEAGSNIDGMGVAWAAGCYAGGGWEDGVLDTLKKIGEYYKGSGESLKGTRASSAFPTVSGTNLISLDCGYVAAKSPDGNTEYIHVLSAPKGNKLTLPNASDGSIYGSASLADGTALTLERSADGYTVTLPDGFVWSDVDNVIVLKRTGKEAVSETKEYIRDTDTSIIYKGDWEYSRWERNSGDYENDVHITASAGASAVFEFDGNGIEIISPMYKTAGKCRIILDGEETECDEFARTYHAQSILFSAKGLDEGHHTLEFVAEEGEVAIDGFIVYR